MTQGPIDLRGEPSLVLCFDPELAEAAACVGGERATLVCDVPLKVTGLGRAPRVPWSELGAVAHPGIRRLVILAARSVAPWSLAGALRRCARESICYVVNGQGSWVRSNRRGALALGLEGWARRLAARAPGARALSERARRDLVAPWPSLAVTLALPAEVARVAQAREPRGAPRVVHYVGGLGPGGAERQLSLLAARTRQRGIQVEVWTAHALEGAAAHYLPDLERAGVRVRSLHGEDPWPGVAALRRRGLSRLREHLRADALLPLITALDRERPDVLHCWLDEGNALGGLAGAALGVPRIVLGVRNVSPAHFPRLLQPWFRPTYRALTRLRSVRLVGNSQAGAADYASWLGLAPERVAWVYNGVPLEQVAPLDPATRARRRALLGLSPRAFVVVGAFRLDEEKRPSDFLRTLAGLRERVPELRAYHLGIGALAQQARRKARELGLSDVLEFRGRVPDPQSYLQIADATLLTSEKEGCPNVAIESQALQVPVVATRGGGTPETVLHERTGVLCEVGDIEGFVDALARLAAEPGDRRTLGRAGRTLVLDRFGVERMVEGSLALYAPTGAPAVRETEGNPSPR